MHGVPVLVCAADGPPLRGERDATDVIGDAFGRQARWVAVPVGRLDDAFFRLSTRVAGEVMQKFVQYGLAMAVVGDISRHTAASSALRALVVESNRGRHVWFVSDVDELRERLRTA
ncbi:DUF4180 domain-containing protein [Sphaerisporangium album]|uniref:DUF4180 domain-containing protein n=2 Tax=Sphaerisporangium album TaxID=509200 RepID=A0A367FUK6_9ACTN|nr:DUF4180 domain-containing protein [Sphaerisporangium album]